MLGILRKHSRQSSHSHAARSSSDALDKVLLLRDAEAYVNDMLPQERRALLGIEKERDSMLSD